MFTINESRLHLLGPIFTLGQNEEKRLLLLSCWFFLLLPFEANCSSWFFPYVTSVALQPTCVRAVWPLGFSGSQLRLTLVLIMNLLSYRVGTYGGGCIGRNYRLRRSFGINLHRLVRRTTAPAAAPGCNELIDGPPLFGGTMGCTQTPNQLSKSVCWCVAQFQRVLYTTFERINASSSDGCHIACWQTLENITDQWKLWISLFRFRSNTSCWLRLKLNVGFGVEKKKRKQKKTQWLPDNGFLEATTTNLHKQALNKKMI